MYQCKLHFYLLLMVLLFVGGCDSQHVTPPSPKPALSPIQSKVFRVTEVGTSNDSISVPASALISRGGLLGVFELRDGTARFRMVRAGRSVDATTQIVAGLRGGETLLLTASSDVRDGSPVQVINSH